MAAAKPTSESQTKKAKIINAAQQGLGSFSDLMQAGAVRAQSEYRAMLADVNAGFITPYIGDIQEQAAVAQHNESIATASIVSAVDAAAAGGGFAVGDGASKAYKLSAIRESFRKKREIAKQGRKAESSARIKQLGFRESARMQRQAGKNAVNSAIINGMVSTASSALGAYMGGQNGQS